MHRITLAHGGGGDLTNELIKKMFFKYFCNDLLLQDDDSTILPVNVEDLSDKTERLVTTTDSYVITPIFFNGGNIGKLSIYGTVNDLAVSGAKPLYITVGFIIEEGFAMYKLEKIVESMGEVTAKADVKIVAGDTKVVEKGSCDEIFINTTGIGVLDKDIYLGGDNAVPGNKVIINGFIGDHGASIMTTRGELGLSSDLKSDCRFLHNLTAEILDKCSEVRVLRDPTRGGIATILNEIASQSRVGIKLKEDKLPVRNEVKKFCNITGFDPLYLANEGKLVAIVDPKEANQVLDIMKKRYPNSAIIGEVIENKKPGVYLETSIGGTRIVNTLRGEMLPRIC